jgi:hypothetical protein
LDLISSTAKNNYIESKRSIIAKITVNNEEKGVTGGSILHITNLQKTKPSDDCVKKDPQIRGIDRGIAYQGQPEEKQKTLSEI